MMPEDIEQFILLSEWFVVVNDTIGGWTIAVVDKPTSQLDPHKNEFKVGDFMMTQKIAEHVVKLHNMFVKVVDTVTEHALAIEDQDAHSTDTP